MEHTPAEAISWMEAGDEHFTGKVLFGPLSAGDVVYSPPGERHWHGATETSFMMHLSLTTGGATDWLSKKVSDEDYRRG